MDNSEGRSLKNPYPFEVRILRLRAQEAIHTNSDEHEGGQAVALRPDIGGRMGNQNRPLDGQRAVLRSAPLLTRGLLLALVGLLGCAPAGPGSQRPSAADGNAAPSPSRPLVVVVKVEPATLSARTFQQAGAGLHFSKRLFNALPALVDDRAIPRPQLLETLPQLNTDTWRVLPDGRMETTYQLKPGLTWHDGQPLTSDDFVFSWQLYSAPDLAQANQPPFHAMEDLVAIDPLRFTIHWKALYPDAGAISARDRELPALPRRVLGPALDQVGNIGPEVIASHSFWTRDYIGLGPYRLERWEPGSQLEAARFDGHVLGPAKIERILLRFSSDANVVTANILAGQIHAATDSAIAQFPEALEREWSLRKAGTIINWPNAWRHASFQLRPEFVNPRAILDPRVRRALAHAIDRQALSEAVYGGVALFADSMIWSRSEWGDALDGSISTYPYDLLRADVLMRDSGFVKGPDGVYVGPDGPLSTEIATSEGADNVPELLIMADGLRKVGIDARERVVPSAQAQDIQVRSTFPGMAISNTNMGEPAMIGFVAENIPGPDNRWRGGNRGGWSTPEYDRLASAFNRTLDRGERTQLVRQMLRIYADELPAVPMYFRAQPFAHVIELRGPGIAAPESSVNWNIYDWEFR
ncbi:MAG: hypothetical protein HW416_831 [Chloroflexi bacterium]|nr:hypothetical protein [Chloroflexota bacterium]